MVNTKGLERLQEKLDSYYDYMDETDAFYIKAKVNTPEQIELYDECMVRISMMKQTLRCFGYTIKNRKIVKEEQQLLFYDRIQKEVEDMEEKEKRVPYFIHEGMMARDERTIKRLIIALMITVGLLFLSNMAWLYVWQQYDYVEEDIDLDSRDGGNANYIGENGDIVNGKNQSSQKNKKKAWKACRF